MNESLFKFILGIIAEYFIYFFIIIILFIYFLLCQVPGVKEEPVAGVHKGKVVRTVIRTDLWYATHLSAPYRTWVYYHLLHDYNARPSPSWFLLYIVLSLC